MPEIGVAITNLTTAHRSAIASTKTQLKELTTSQQLDVHQMEWYGGVSDNGVWGGLKSRMLESGLASAVSQIDQSSEAIVASLAQPMSQGDRRLGLVIGNVQSGKTANYSAVIAKALDSKYKFVLVLSGIHNNLRRQTQLRLERDLGVSEDAANWYRLTHHGNGDFGSLHTRNASAIVAKHTRILAVVKKNTRRLQNFLDFLRSLDSHTMRSTPFLIIDDESDQATPDSSSSVDNDPTKINSLMRQIWQEIQNGAYVGYTATPFANIFMNPNPSQKGTLEELYPRNFVHVMPTSHNYFGAERIFGQGNVADERIDPAGHDVIRSIPRDEAEVLTPKGTAAVAAEMPITQSLEDAIRWFIVATAVRRVRGQSHEHSTMLIHTTHRVAPHFAMQTSVNDYLKPLQRAARDGEISSFHDVFHEEFDRAAELYSESAPAATWPLVSQEVLNVLRTLHVAVDNGSAPADDRLTYTREPQTVIVIGGGTLSRGLTLEGLFVSYFTRTSNTYDTLLQMGRWFGYRPGYEDLQRIWLAPGLEDDYRFLATVEAEVRMEIEQMSKLGQTPNDIGLRVRQHPGRLQITSPSKMKHAGKAEVDFEGFRPQTTLFDLNDPTVLLRNSEAVSALLNRIKPNRVQTSTGKILFEGIPVSELHDFFDTFVAHPDTYEVFKGAYSWSQSKLPKKPWNVVIQSGSEHEFSVADISVQGVRRAPIKTSADELQRKKLLNIRALAGGNDLVADLSAKGSITNSSATKGSQNLSNGEQVKLRKTPSGVNGAGLLVLYPISSKSKTMRANQTRMNMDDALQHIDPELTTRDPFPIWGISLVAPYDTQREIPSKGTFISVTPVFGEPEESDEPPVEDSEPDYQGDTA